MPLRIAAIAYTHYESDPRVRREAEALAARGDRVTAFVLRREGAQGSGETNGVEVVRLPVARYRGASAARYVASYVQFAAAAKATLVARHARDRFDVVHIHTMPDFLVLAALVPRLSGAKIVLDMHDLMPSLYALKFGGRGRAVRGLELAQKMATGLADAVLSVHANQYELLLRDGVPARKLAIVMNSADPALFPPRAKEPRIQEGGPIRVVYHGTILHRYGVDVALEAFARARREAPSLHLEVIGGGDFAGEARRIADRLGLGPEALEMNGLHLPLDQVAARVRGAHIGLVPNRDDHEDSVLPTKLMEYLAIGVPAIAVSTRTVSRYFSGEEVELVPIGDPERMAEALLRLAADPARRKALVKAGHAWTERYGWEVNKQFLFRTFDAVCADKVERQRKEAQKAKEGVKTGRISTPPKGGLTTETTEPAGSGIRP